jgi:hypothetical protein
MTNGRSRVDFLESGGAFDTIAAIFWLEYGLL